MRQLFLFAALSLTSLGFSAAQAQTLSVNIDASVRFPSLSQTTSTLLGLLSQGVQVSFLTPTSQPAATLNKTGGITVHSATPGALPALTQVQVATPIPGTTQVVKEVYPLAQPLSASKPISAQSIVVRPTDGQAQPLVNVMGRQAAWAKAKGLQKKPGGMPPGQLKQLCKKEPKNKLCATPAPAPSKGHGKH
ncbi:hypothetical protein WDJ50_06940 [Deinococcus sp. VB142]|uniref:Uncharacterized protein n=1 Tax=Deinococcus sp. VB142 TaxID=3112952 RepID=A0AAU6Q6D0_9DEIO